MFSDAAGDVPAGSIGGLVHHDTRSLSRCELTINGARLHVLSSCTVDAYSAEFFMTNPELPGLNANTVCTRRAENWNVTWHPRHRRPRRKRQR
jgi:hypothetical protein